MGRVLEAEPSSHLPSPAPGPALVGAWVRILWDGDTGDGVADAAPAGRRKRAASSEAALEDADAAARSAKDLRRSARTTAEGCWYTARVTAHDALRGTYTLRYIADQEVRLED